MHRWLLMLLLGSCLPLPAWAVELVRDGQPLAEIVVAAGADPSVKAAGRELQKYLKKMSGAELPIVARPSGATPIYVGASAYTDKLGIRLEDIRNDGFKIVVADKHVALVGRDQCRLAIPRDNTKFGIWQSVLKNWQKLADKPWDYPYIIRDPRNFSHELGFHVQDANGTLYAVYEFLEQLGVRWFMPIEEIGLVIPEKRDIKLAPMVLKREPFLACRFLLLVGIGKNPAEFLWYKQLKQGGVFDPFPSHSSELITECQHDRPELFGFAGGKPIETGRRRYDHGPRHLPRLSSPQLREELAEYLVKFHDAFPEVPYLPLGQPDGWVVMDDRDVAAGWDKKEEGHRGRFADYTWDFVLNVANRVRQQRPDLKFCTSSYGCAKNPPKLINTIPENIAVNLSQNSTLPEFDDDLARRKEWLAKAPHSDIFIYDYYLSHYPRRSLVPVPAIFTTQMEKNFRALPDRCRVVYTELSWSTTRQHGLVVGFPGINHLMIYLHAKFTWNKDLDVQATLTDYFEKFYGPASQEMREFFEYAEAVWMRPEVREITAAGGFLKPADVPKYFEILDRAKAKAGDGIYGKRVQFIADEIAPLKKLFSELKRTGPYVRVFPRDLSPQVDGDLAKPFWTEQLAAEKVWLKDCVTGVQPDINTTSVAFRWLPDSSLLVGIVCHERRMNRLRANTPASAKDDHAIYSGDNVEVHLETPAGYRAVVVVNPNGAVRDTCVTPNVADVPEAWSAERVAVRKLPDRWTVEIKIKGLGDMPNKSYPWGVNVFRQRQAGGEEEAYALSPTGTGSFINAPTKMGNLYGRAK
ncbi:MAG: DUF4838 domain-containing protein [Verrucomicrobia bacterium]|nr:DUF4838 domain-containing protein [Verrucomicrobiota bacterium]